jgi:hypothetical protein
MLLLALLAALIAPATAAAKVKNPAVRLTSCDASLHAVKFTGDMRAHGPAVKLQKRFALQTRSKTQPTWTHVPADGFDTWSTAMKGVTHYISDKQVLQLAVGSVYRAVVAFRWRDTNGHVVTKSTLVTKICRQPDQRANLKVKSINMSQGSTPAKRTYTVKVLNRGFTAAPTFDTGLEVNGSALDAMASAGPLDPGASTLLVFEGPRCQAGTSVVATADAGSVVDEANEMDNALTLPCPARRR